MGSSSNTFFWNNFITPMPVYMDGTINIWDEGYPSGGNYWSAYTGTDANHDGIGDTPYVIDENNIDNYPLISPWTEQKNLYLIVRGSNNGIYYRSYNSSEESWSSWTGLPGSTPDSPAAFVIGEELHLVVRGMTGNSIWHGYVNLDDNSFSGFTQLSGSMPSAPILTGNSTHLCLVLRGSNNVIYYRWYDLASETWGSWTGFPYGSTPDVPAATITGDSLQVVVRGMTGDKIWHGSLDLAGDVWSGWSQLDGTTPSKPVLTS